MESLSFRILGPVEVEHDGHLLDLGSPKVRALLALLLLHANELVSRDFLIEELWGGRPPPTAGHSLSVYVSRLRKVWGGDGDHGSDALLTRPGGYVLRVDPGRVDACVFERLATEAKLALAAGEAADAADKLRRALALWHGSALADIAFEPFALVEARRLEELRLEAVEARIEAELAQGKHEDLTAELGALVAEHPLRERLVRQLMLALYRSGRQADALEVYRHARSRLVEELGIEPSADLQRLQRDVLQHAPGLAVEPRRLPEAAGNTARTMVSDAVVGSEIGGYRIECELGRGVAGEVYLAYDSRLGRKVALKLLPPALAADAAFRQRFVRETLLTAALDHPNVIPVYDAGQAAGRLYMAMRYIPGGSLRGRLRKGPLEPGEAVAIVAQIAAALDCAHEQRFVHRDVKPENILIDSTGTAYLVDFFVASPPAEPGAVFGTPPYMAPEQCRADEVNGRADLYSLGCVLFEALSGTPPFGDLGQRTVAAQINDPVPKLSERCPELPETLDRVFEKALAKRPSERYESGQALIAAFTAALAGRDRSPESGTVTFVFTEIDDPTRLLRRLREQYPNVVAQHQRLLRAAFLRRGGREVDARGEALFAAFPTARDAVLAAAAAQRELAGHRWAPGAEVRVRIGIHTGRAAVAGERYFGLAVHRAARISAVAEGGQTLLSETTHALLEDEEEDLPGLELRALGRQRLKDFERPVDLYELVRT